MTRRLIAILSPLACVAGFAVAATAAADASPPPTGPTLYARPGGMLGQVLRFRGSLGSDQAGRTVSIERQAVDGTWTPTATAAIAADGTFIARWRTDEVGRFTVRALIDGADAQAAAALPPATTVSVYRPARATFFGPGFYGRRTACGQIMSQALIGVAHRTLPCGTQVDVFYAGRTVTVPVVDRGPFANGASYDLTSAAAQALGMTQTVTVGVAPSREPLAPAAPVPPLPYAGTGGAAA
ncbi:MAG: rare lipoprotein [Solirubrobacteraceae bacterium]|nr:rare lipoprotein [Solirubrobacteraceae bacterium]